MAEVTRPSECRFAVHPDQERVAIRMNGALDTGVAPAVRRILELTAAESLFSFVGTGTGR